ncbi:phosphoribosyltransferase family protein [Alloalcanivorax profundimaris]|uniref:phosphoribosyltransferase family protein n=1 Tax=Alloalcanivorax profundimaris TaxID=2735259 RepID=UPI0018879640|nr:phosphoribosyltransferase family protein [Alloalcanivorax profundimaris]MBF1801748.1 ComF family protein [Alloalcanivorax profundimaris]
MFFDLSNQCVLCGRRADSGLCPHCHRELERHCALSGPLCRCALPGPGLDPGALCGRCLDRPPGFAASYCAWAYRFPLDRLLNAYKHRGRLTVERALETLTRAQPLPWPEADLICPLPAHWRRRWWRGFDQAERLAASLGRRWRRPVVPVLTRPRATRHQQGQSRATRVRSLRHAFRADPRARGRRILLVDDVMTTGASARAAARALGEAGAAEVRVWVLARTLRSGAGGS